MLDLPIVDTHLHVWDTAVLRYPWLDGNDLLNRPYLPSDYRRATAGYNVEQMVFVQAEADFSLFAEEAAWVTLLARDEPRIAGIVAWAPLELGDGARPALEGLARNPLMRGIRRIIQFEPDIDFCLRPDFVRGVQALPDYGLSFDICINPTQLANTILLVEQCPRVCFVLDHIAKPNIAEREWQPWAAQIQTLAGFDNVCCKLSGLVTEADHAAWQEPQLQPYLEHVVGAFGTERVMFGGDWPVVLQASPWARWIEALSAALTGLAPGERAAVFAGNARRFYRLESQA
ncbi:MAG: amidohydrolase family protein [Chloroflexi bacterium]|nr:amidohydrolase family protein [Chloroflexota bacterium]